MKNLFSGKNALILAATLVLVGGFVAHRFVFTPLVEQIRANEQRIRDLQSRIDAGLAAKAQAAKLEKEIAELRRENQKLTARLPRAEQYTDLMDEVTRVAEQQMGLEVQEISRTKPRPFQEGVYVGRLEVSVKGTFQQLYRLLAYVEEEIKRFSRVSLLEIAPAAIGRDAKEDKGKVRAKLALEFYFQEGGGQ